MEVKKFFKGLGKGLALVGKYVLKFATDAQIDVVVGIVTISANKFIDNAERREWAVAQVQKELKVPESIARWLVETALLHVKARVAESIHDVGDKAKTFNN